MAQVCDAAVFGDVIDFHAKITASSVDVEGSHLKNPFLAPSVEIAKGDEVVEQSVKAAVITDEAIH